MRAAPPSSPCRTADRTNQFFVYGFTDADVPGFAAQQIAAVPEPKSWAMLIAGFGLIGAALRRRVRTILPA